MQYPNAEYIEILWNIKFILILLEI
jgi:hypothetical protein